MSVAVELRHISKRFPGVIANKDVSMKVETGTVHALVGENGAGKSTVMKILYGMQRPDGGEILVNGQAVNFKNPNDAIESQQTLIAAGVADFFPSSGIKRRRICFPQIVQRGHHDPRAEDRPKRHQIGVGPAVRLHVSVLHAEQLAGLRRGIGFNRIDIVAAGIKATARNALGIFVSQQIAHRQLRRQRAIVFTRDELQVAALIGQFLHNRPGDGRFGGRDH